MTELSSSVSLSGQVAIVTGAGRGLGRIFALALAERGAKVVINGRDPHAVAEQAVVDEISDQAGEAVVEIASVSDSAAVAAMVGRVLKRWGRIDILVNNAGITRDARFAQSPLSDIKAVIDTHLMGAVNCCHAVWPAMQQQRYGRILMMTSMSGLVGNVGQVSYAAAKMGLIGMMHSLAIEGGKSNIHVNAMSPVGVTRMNERFLPASLHDTFADHKVTAGATFLTSPQAPNGTILLAGGNVYESIHSCVSAGIVEAADESELEQGLHRLSADPQWEPFNSVAQQLQRVCTTLGISA